MTLSSNGIIGKANEAVEKTNIRQIESLATMLWAEAYAEHGSNQGALEGAVKEGLRNNGITEDKYAGYRMEVTVDGVTFVKSNSSGGNYPTASDDYPTSSDDYPTSSDDYPSGDSNWWENYVPDASVITHAGVIPEGGQYITSIASSDYSYWAGEQFPETMYGGDRYIYGDYRYTYYPEYNGWQVSVNSNVVNKYSDKTFGVILTSINDVYVTNMDSTFSECYNMAVSPVIPSGVTSLRGTYEFCSLKVTPTIPAGVKDMAATFKRCSITVAPILPDGVEDISGIFSDASVRTYQGSTDPDYDFSNYIIPSSVTNMSYMFAYSYNIQVAPAIPASVTNVAGLFDSSGSLRTYAGSTDADYDFSNYVIPEGVTDISYMFQYTSITKAPTIPSTVTNADYAFYRCSYLTSAKYNGNIEQWETVSNDRWAIETPLVELVCNNGSVCVVHTGGTATCQQKATCDKCGNEYGELASHIGGTATCQQRAICDNCGNEYGELASHISANGSCTVCGSVVTTIESSHSPYENNINFIVLGTWDYSDATSVNITITYQTEGISWDWCSIVEGTDYVSGNTVDEPRNYLTTSGTIKSTIGWDDNVKFGDSSLMTKTFSNVDMLTGSVIFVTDGSGEYFYGAKVQVSPNY